MSLITKEYFNSEFTLDNWKDILIARNALHYTLNSVIIVAASTILTVFFGCLTDYALTRFQFKSRRALLWDLLTLRMVPPVVAIVPLFLLVKQIGLLNTYLPIIIAYTAFNLPFAILLMRGFYVEIPIEVEESAMLDGCSIHQIFARIILPLSKGGIIVTAVFMILLSWNEFVFAITLLGNDTFTLPVALSALVSFTKLPYGSLAAMTIYTIIPLFIIMMFVQKHLVKGITMGAIKG